MPIVYCIIVTETNFLDRTQFYKLKKNKGKSSIFHKAFKNPPTLGVARTCCLDNCCVFEGFKNSPVSLPHVKKAVLRALVLGPQDRTGGNKLLQSESK